MRSTCCCTSAGRSHGIPGNRHTNRNRPVHLPTPHGRLNGGPQIVILQLGIPQIHHRAPRFGQAVARHLLRRFQMIPRFRALLSHLHGNRIQLRRQPDETLRQRIVNLARNARSLVQHQREPAMDLPQPELPGSDNETRQRRCAKPQERAALIEMRQNFETDGIFRPPSPAPMPAPGTGSHRAAACCSR